MSARRLTAAVAALLACTAAPALAQTVAFTGGKVVIVDYHKPRAWHPLKPLMRLIFKYLEPFAMDLWRHDLAYYLPADGGVLDITHATAFGGLYQIRVLKPQAQSTPA